MYPNLDACPEIPYQYITAEHHLFDLIYNPTETKFLTLGKQKGASIQNGYEMLILQAEESWRIWNELN
jgi:shikimate dehydrogenase